MSDDIPRARRADAATDGAAAEVPAGGRGADTGAADVTRIDETDQAPVQNISSQNDIAGVGTRAADGSIEHSDTRSPVSERRAARSAQGEQAAPSRSDDAPSLAREYEPGVDPARARASRVAGPAASEGDPGSPSDRPQERIDRVADTAANPVIRVVVGGVLGLVTVVLFALATPVAPAVAWIGIALEVALFAVLAVSAAALRPGHYRRVSTLVASLGMLIVGVVFGAILLALALAR